MACEHFVNGNIANTKHIKTTQKRAGKTHKIALKHET